MLLASLTGVWVLLACSAPAAADSVAVAVSPNPAIVTYPAPEPVVTVSGMAARQYLRVVSKLKPAGQGPCAATANGDGGTEWWNSFGPAQAADGSFTSSSTPQSIVDQPLGSYTVCAWAERADGSTVGPATTVLVLRAPSASLAMSPPLPDPAGHGFAVTLSYSLEAGSAVINALSYDDPRGTHPCPSSDVSLPAGSLAPFSDFRVGGPSPLAGSVTHRALAPFGGLLEVGLWRVCAYMTLGESSPLASSGGLVGAPLAFAAGNVVIPGGSSAGAHRGAAQCRVPDVRRLSLARARRALTSAHCALGKVTRRRLAGRRRGTVVSQGARPGSHLRSGSRVSLVIAR